MGTPKYVKPGLAENFSTEFREIANGHLRPSLAQVLPHITQGVEHERIEVFDIGKVKNDCADGGVANLVQESGLFLEQVGVAKAKVVTQCDGQETPIGAKTLHESVKKK